MMSEFDFVVDKDALEVRSSRVFKASRERIWQAVTDPEQIAQWWGPRNLKTTVDTHEFRVGGKWRLIHEDDKGDQYAFRGEFREIVKPEKIVETFEFEPMPGHVLLETMTLEELEPGVTRMSTVAKFDTIEDLDGMVDSGMEQGDRESHERLAELVEA
jgi:uncharacterized protein YndB with AHSA1/START domain